MRKFIQASVALIIFGFFPLIADCQDEKDIFRYKLQNSMEFLRDDAVARSDSIEVKALIEDLRAIDSYGLVISYISDQIDRIIGSENTHRKDSIQKSKFKPITDSLDSNHVQIIEENSHVFLLIQQGIVRLDTSLATWKMSRRFFEIYSLYIRPNQTVLEVGGGKGIDILLMAKTYLTTNFIMNEIDTNDIKFVREYSKLLGIKNLSVIQGAETDTNCAERVDRVFIKHTLHHFSKPEAMLLNIKASMKEDAKLILVEFVPSKNGNGCKKALKQSTVHRFMRKSKFKRIERYKKRERYLEHYIAK